MVQTPDPSRRLKFGENDGFYKELRRRVDEYFRFSGRRRRDCPQMYMKTAIILAVFTTAYVLLVFVAQSWWQALTLAGLLGFAAVGIGFHI
jgi:linoleoyl-CoA desaturase